MGQTTLVLGGARSGKSEVAEAMADRLGGPVTYVATAPSVDPSLDPDWAARVALHRTRRPAAWTTIEDTEDLLDVLRRLSGTVLVDSLGAWVAATDGFAVDAARLVDVLATRTGHTIVVSDEVGLGVHPETEVGLAFRDALGAVNRAVAGVAGDAWLVVAGRLLRLVRP